MLHERSSYSIVMDGVYDMTIQSNMQITIYLCSLHQPDKFVHCICPSSYLWVFQKRIYPSYKNIAQGWAMSFCFCLFGIVIIHIKANLIS